MRVMTPLAREAYCLAWEGMSVIARADLGKLLPSAGAI